jgi:hypothetical protein
MDLDEVVVTCAGDEVARHPLSWAKHRTVTDPFHELAGKVMRVFAAAVANDGDGEVRGLSVYDRADRGGVMSARTASKSRSDIAYLCRALKAPSLAGAVERLGERARTEA